MVRQLLYLFLITSLWQSSFAGRSDLYPDDWSLGFNHNGAKLKDYSFAGYKNANVDLPSIDSFNVPTYNVIDYGADPTGVDFSDAAVSEAISDANDSNGGKIFFPPGIYKLSHSHTITSDNTFLMKAIDFEYFPTFPQFLSKLQVHAIASPTFVTSVVYKNE